jgi:hypothetical protein
MSRRIPPSSYERYTFEAPEPRPIRRRERDPDEEYDRERQERLDRELKKGEVKND